MGLEVNKKQLAETIGKSPRWVDKLVEQGLPVKSGGGKGKPKLFDTAEVVDWLIQHEITRRFGDGEEIEQGSSADEDRLLKRARREELQLKIDQRRGTLSPNAASEDIAFNIAGIYASQLYGLGPRVAGDLSAMDDPAEIVYYLHEETRRIRAATAELLMEETSKLSEEADRLYATGDSESGGLSTESDAE